MKNYFITSLLALSLINIACEKKTTKEVTSENEVITTNTTTSEDLGKPGDIVANEGAFKMQGLPYEYNALEPYMDAKTVATHYGKHHLGYANKLNDAIKDTPLATKSIEEILKSLDLDNTALRNNAGGYYNHNLFWQILTPKAGGEPTGEIATLITRDFGSFDAFKTAYNDASKAVFGSGWVWLILDGNNKLQITNTANQDNPLMPNAKVKGIPLLNIDVWEHAYYLLYKNDRAKYIDNYWNLVNWSKVNEILQQNKA